MKKSFIIFFDTSKSAFRKPSKIVTAQPPDRKVGSGGSRASPP
jgi:hypothetical protein